MRLYFDTSALNRIFDNQSQPRIYLEATAILIVYLLMESENLKIVSSDVLFFENDKNPYIERRSFVNSILKKSTETQLIDDKILVRAQEIQDSTLKELMPCILLVQKG